MSARRSASEAGAGADREAAGRAHRPRRPASRSRTRRAARRRASRPAEGLRRSGQVEGDEAVEAEGDDAVHGRNLADIVIPASGEIGAIAANIRAWKSQCCIFDGLAALDAIGPYEVLRNVPGWEVAARRQARRARSATKRGTLGLIADHALDEVDRAGHRPRPRRPRQPAAARGRGAARLAARGRPRRRSGRPRSAPARCCSAPPACWRASGRPTNWLVLDALRDYGADPVGGRFVEDGKVITAAGVTAGIDMALHLVAREVGPEVAQAIQLGIEYDPDPPFDSGSPEKAPAGDRRAGPGGHQRRIELHEGVRQAGFGLKRSPWRKRPEESQKLQAPGQRPSR